MAHIRVPPHVLDHLKTAEFQTTKFKIQVALNSFEKFKEQVKLEIRNEVRNEILTEVTKQIAATSVLSQEEVKNCRT